jgi:hypothetical protein
MPDRIARRYEHEHKRERSKHGPHLDRVRPLASGVIAERSGTEAS